MISRKDLRELAQKRLRDAKVLLSNRRYQGAIYLAGYTIEFLLKYNICKIFIFNKGFPESISEFNSYKSKVKKRFTSITSIKDFKTHNLPRLLTYSGKEYDVKAKALIEWDLVKVWSPEFRYLNDIINRQNANNIIIYVEKIRNILLS